MYSDGVKVGKPKAKQEMANIVSESIKGVSTYYTGAKTAGENLIEGVNQGVANESKQNSVFNTIYNFGSQLLSRFQSSLDERSPSRATKKMGAYLLEGLGIGIKDEEKDTLKQVAGVGRNVISALNDELSVGATVGKISVGTPEINGHAIDTPQGMVAAFKDALGGVKIVLDDEVAGSFVDTTVSKLIYS